MQIEDIQEDLQFLEAQVDDLHFEIDDLRELVEKLMQKLNDNPNASKGLETTQQLVDDI